MNLRPDVPRTDTGTLLRCAVLADVATPAPINVSGSGCSLGHPIAATGARMITTLVHELRRRGGGVAVAAMCAGGGIGSATVLEVHGA